MSEKSKEILNSFRNFAQEMYEKLIESQKDEIENTFFSPLSVYTILGMTLLGTEGNTRKELRQAMKIAAELDKPDLASVMGSTLTSYLLSKKGVDIEMANSLFLDEKFTINSEVDKELRDHFKSEAKLMKFKTDPTGSAQIMNNWIKEHTKSKLENLISPSMISHLTQMFTINALCFKGAWWSPFLKERTIDGKFYPLTGEPMDVKMMCKSKVSHKYVQLNELNARAIKYGFAVQDWEMLIVLPNKMDGLKDLLKQLKKPEAMNKMLNTDFNFRNLTVHLPRFKLSEFKPIDVKEVLKSMSVQDLFDEKANLKRLTPIENVFVNAILHKAVLEVDEEGATATASTIGETRLMSTAPPDVFMVDHPFVVAIVYDKTIPIFIGHVVKPEVF